MIAFVASAVTPHLIIGQIHLGSAIAQLAVNAGVAIGVTCVVIVLALHRTGSFRHFANTIRTNVKKILCRVRR